MTKALTKKPTGKKFLNTTVAIWFTVAVIGQWIFAYYVSSVYATTAASGDFLSWNEHLPHGYEEGNSMGNFAVIMHVLVAIVITIAGPLQFIPKLRSRFPVFHRYNGRVFLLTVLIMSISGLYLQWSGREVVGDISQWIPLQFSSFLMIIFAFLTVRKAMGRDFKSHRKWALRLFIIVNGGWFYRIGLMFWLAINGGPVGLDFETFTGPFLTALAICMHGGVIPLGILELYFYAQEKGKRLSKTAMSIAFIILTLCMMFGTFIATVGMWFPSE